MPLAPLNNCPSSRSCSYIQAVSLEMFIPASLRIALNCPMLNNGRKRSRPSQDGVFEYKPGLINPDTFLPIDSGNSLFSFDKNTHMVNFPAEDPHFVSEFLNDEIEKVFQTHPEPRLPPGAPCVEVSASHPSVNQSSNTSPHDSPFECYVKQESVTSDENARAYELKIQAPAAEICADTVATLKRAMAGGSRLAGTFTVLKVTYLKLCKEFNFLLGKFNENERIKIELIYENNELRKLLWNTIKEREMDRKQYKAQLAELQT